MSEYGSEIWEGKSFGLRDKFLAVIFISKTENWNTIWNITFFK